MKITIDIIQKFLKKTIPDCTDVQARREYGSVEAIYVIDGKINTYRAYGFMKDFKDIDSVKTRFKMIL